jgi:hypothetical protein
MKEKVKIDKKLQNKKKLSSALKQNLLRRKAGNGNVKNSKPTHIVILDT